MDRTAAVLQKSRTGIKRKAWRKLGGCSLCCKSLKCHRTHTGGKQTSLKKLLLGGPNHCSFYLFIVEMSFLYTFLHIFLWHCGTEISSQVWEFLIYLESPRKAILKLCQEYMFLKK